MSRRNARKNAFYLIFQLDFTHIDEVEETKEIFFRENVDIDEIDRKYITQQFDGVVENIEIIDETITSVAKGWSVDRMSKVDLAILRLAIFEMKYCEDIPVSVAVNEAVELAKKYSSDEAPAFINGILGKLA